MADAEKFDRVPDDELRKYVEDSAQLPGESDDDWARRVRNAEDDLIRAHKDDPPKPSVKDDPLSSVAPGEDQGTSGEGSQ